MKKFFKKVASILAAFAVVGTMLSVSAFAADEDKSVWSMTSSSDCKQIKNYYKSKGRDAQGNSVTIKDSSGKFTFEVKDDTSKTPTSTPVLDKTFGVYTLTVDGNKYEIEWDKTAFDNLSDKDQSKATSEMLQTVSAWQLDTKSVTSLAETLENRNDLVFSKADAVAILFNQGADIMGALTWFMPFQGALGLILGVGVIIVMALLLLSTVLDLVYIGMPTARMAMSAKAEGQGKEIPFGISTDAYRIVQQTAETGAGGNGGNQGNPYLQYFKKRFVTYIILAVCILYLLSGQIGGLISGLLNLASGITG